MITFQTSTERARGKASFGLAAFAAGAAAFVALSGTAHAAQSYPPSTSCTIAASSSAGSTTVTGTGFSAGKPVAVHSSNGSAASPVAGSNGSFQIVLSGVGSEVSSSSGGCSSTAAVSQTANTSVVATNPNAVPGGSHSLAFTGLQVTAVAGLGAVMLAGGSLLIFQGRRRKSSSDQGPIGA